MDKNDLPKALLVLLTIGLVVAGATAISPFFGCVGLAVFHVGPAFVVAVGILGFLLCVLGFATRQWRVATVTAPLFAAGIMCVADGRLLWVTLQVCKTAYHVDIESLDPSELHPMPIKDYAPRAVHAMDGGARLLVVACADGFKKYWVVIHSPHKRPGLSCIHVDGSWYLGWVWSD